MNSIVNRTIGTTPFSVVYTKQFNCSVDLLNIPHPVSKSASSWVKDYAQFHEQVQAHIQKINEKYKVQANKRQSLQVFEVRDLVMVYPNKHRLPHGCPMLQNRRHGPFSIIQKINDNFYII